MMDVMANLGPGEGQEESHEKQRVGREDRIFGSIMLAR